MDAVVETRRIEPTLSSADRARNRMAGLLAACSPLLRPLALFAASRALVLVASAVGSYLASQAGKPVLSGPWPAISGSGSGAVDGLLRWDSAWYTALASEGYPRTAADGHIAFFPLFPGLVRATMAVTGLRPALAGLVVATVFGALATVLVWILGRRLAGAAAADRMAALFAFFPGSIALSMVYSEGVLIVLAVACLLALDSRRWIWAGVFAALATATRPNGLALGAACAWAAVVAVRRHREWMALAAPALAPLGILTFFAYLARHTGEPSAWFIAQREIWHERIAVTAQVERVRLVIQDPLSPVGDLNTTLPLVGMVLMAIGLLVLWRWRPGGAVVVYTVVACAIVLLSATIGARPRMVLAAFPVVLALAYAVRGVWFTALLGISAACLALLTVLTIATSTVTP